MGKMLRKVIILGQFSLETAREMTHMATWVPA